MYQPDCTGIAKATAITSMRPARQAFAPAASHCLGQPWRTDMLAILLMIVRSTGTKASKRLSRRLSASWEGIAGYYFRRSAVISLNELGDRALRDIGLQRSQIEAAVSGLVTIRRKRVGVTSSRSQRAWSKRAHDRSCDSRIFVERRLRCRDARPRNGAGPR